VRTCVNRHLTSLVRKPGAGNPPARFDEQGVEMEHGQTLRHRQSKEPATVYAGPKPPRHTSTLLQVNLKLGLTPSADSAHLTLTIDRLSLHAMCLLGAHPLKAVILACLRAFEVGLPCLDREPLHSLGPHDLGAGRSTPCWTRSRLVFCSSVSSSTLTISGRSYGLPEPNRARYVRSRGHCRPRSSGSLRLDVSRGPLGGAFARSWHPVVGPAPTFQWL